MAGTRNVTKSLGGTPDKKFENPWPKALHNSPLHTPRANLHPTQLLW